MTASQTPAARHPAIDAQRLLVLIPDALSDLVSKGEVTERYYNPGSLFREVHIVMTNDDLAVAGAIQPMVGTAELHLHNYPPARWLFGRTLGWRPRLLRRWASDAVELAREIQPQLVRCHGAFLNAFLASEIHRHLGVPYVMSMHINPDRDIRHHWKGHEGDWRAQVQARAAVAMERAAIANAACVVCVYRFIDPYARKMGARRVEVIYNVVNAANILEKDEYSLGDPPRVILPGRQFFKKDPRPVVEALASVPRVHCTFVGDGPLHEAAIELAAGIGVYERCTFVRALPNDELCRSLRNYDIVVSVNDYGGVSKVELEAALVGMPIVTNSHPLEDVPEVLGDACLAVAGDAESYAEALHRLIDDEALRAQLGRRVRQNASGVRPELMEERYVALYSELLSASPAP